MYLMESNDSHVETLSSSDIFVRLESLHFVNSMESYVSHVETLSSSDIIMIFVAKSRISIPRTSTRSGGQQLFVLSPRGCEEMVSRRELDRSLRLRGTVAPAGICSNGQFL